VELDNSATKKTTTCLTPVEKTRPMTFLTMPTALMDSSKTPRRKVREVMTSSVIKMNFKMLRMTLSRK
jgi:hypothetical protein